MSARTTSPVATARINAALMPVLASLLSLLAVAFLHSFEPDAAGFEQKGLLLVLYHASRLWIALYITVVCYCAGYLALRAFRVDPRELFDSARKAFILCFFLGASLYGVAFSALGLAGLIGLGAGLVATLPVLLLSSRPLRALAQESQGSVTRDPDTDTHAGPVFVRFVILAAVGAAMLFLVTRTLFIAVIDPNIWEHYLHYYRSVLASGSTQPNEVWHHFYATKGGGLIFLANVLSDFFGVQLVSACFVAAAAVIILDLLLDYCRSTSWAYFGVMLFLAFLCGEVADGATFKHHAVILGYIAFALWGSIRLQQATAGQHKPLIVVLGVSLFYFGFYQPAMLALVTPAFVLLVLMNAVLLGKTHLRSHFILASGLVAGGALVFGTNWALTGLPELTPMRTIWVFADRMKAAQVFGLGGPEFFLSMNNNLAADYDWSLGRTWKILRYSLPAWVVFGTLAGVLVLLARKGTRGKTAPAATILVPIAAFTLPLSAFAQAVQTAAVDRVALYSVVMTTLASVVMLKIIVDACLRPGTWPAIPVRIVVGGNSLFDRCVEIGPRRIATAVVIVLGMSFAALHAWRSVGKTERLLIVKYVVGAMSLKDSMQAVESISSKATTGVAVGVAVAEMTEFRKAIPAGERVLRLAYDGGFSYSLPGEGIVSEPTYSLIRDPESLLAAKPDEVVEYLRARKVNYFTLNLQGNLFTTVAFTTLFDVREMPRYFSVAYEDGDRFILTWRRSEREKPLPPYLLTLFELKQSGVLNYPFTVRFARRVLSDENQMVTTAAQYEDVRVKFMGKLDNVFGAEALRRASLETSQAALRRMLDAAHASTLEAYRKTVDFENACVPELVEKLPGLRVRLEQRIGIGGVLLTKSSRKRDVQAHLLDLYRKALFQAYIEELGSGIAALSLSCDERVPFARKYPADASCY